MRRSAVGLLPWIVVAATAAATAASAADLPVPGPVAAAPVYRPAIYDWSGFYVGGHVGGAWANDTVTTTTTTALQPAGTASRVTVMGVAGGAQAGFNVEFAPVVVGVEATWTATSLTGTQTTPSPLVGGFSQRSTDAVPWFYTAAARIGYAANDLLIYAKGGGAWARAEYTQAVTLGSVVSLQTLTDNRTGFVAGGGFEYGLNENLSIKLEYDYLGLGTKTYTFPNLSYSPAAGVVTPIGPFPVSVRAQIQMVSVGVNYRFNWH